MIEHLAGVAALLMAAAVVVILGSRYRTVAVLLVSAYAVRAGPALFHRYVASLPDGNADAKAYEKIAWGWGKEGLVATINSFPGMDSHFYSWVVALVYASIGRFPLVAQSFSVLAGTLSVFLVWWLARELWDERHARKAAWIAALFPTLILYSALTMREPFVVLFLLMGLIAFVQWVREDSAATALYSGLAFLAATFFHGGMFVALIVLGGYLAVRHGKLWLKSLRQAKIRLLSSALLVGVFIGVASYVVLGFSIPKLGSAEDLVDFGRYLHRIDYSDRGMARYPGWAVPVEEWELLWKAPIRVTYFLFGPFVWDLGAPRHLIGWLDGVFYVAISLVLLRNIKVIWNMPEARAVLLVLGSLVVVFGFAVGNFGTGLRHRSKLVCGALVLIAPKLPRLVRAKRRESRTTGIGNEG